jgi:hypothetical protein
MELTPLPTGTADFSEPHGSLVLLENV